MLHSFGQDEPKVPKPAAKRVALEYVVIQDTNAQNLERRVVARSAKGWRLQGGVGVGSYASDGGKFGQNKETRYVQALVRGEH